MACRGKPEKAPAAVAEPAAAAAQAQATWGYGQTIAGLMIALLAPVLGAIADGSGRRMVWIWFFSLAITGRFLGRQSRMENLFANINKFSALFIWGSAAYMGYLLLTTMRTGNFS